MRRPLAVCFFVIVSAFALSLQNAPRATAADGVQLRWNFQPGMTLGVTMSQDMKMTTMSQGGPQVVDNSVKQWMTWQVADVDSEGNATIQATIDRMKMQMDLPGVGAIVVDSDQKAEDGGLAERIAAMIQPMVGVQFRQKMTPRGKVYDVVVPEKALAGMQNGPLAQMGLSGDMIKEMAEKASPEFPQKAVQQGEQWNSRAVTQSPAGKIQLDTEYTYQGPQQDSQSVHQIGVKMNMSFLPGEGPQGAKITIADQDNTGTFLFDNQSGRMIKATMDQNMTMKIQAAGQTFEQKLDQDIVTTFTPNG